MNLIDKIKLKLCGDFLSIASLKMQIEDLQLENEELKQKNKTISNNNRSYSKEWEDMFYKDWAEEIYQSEMKQELIEENSELYSQLQELARIHEEYKKETNDTIQNLENKVISKNSLYEDGILENSNLEEELDKIQDKYDVLQDKYNNLISVATYDNEINDNKMFNRIYAKNKEYEDKLFHLEEKLSHKNDTIDNLTEKLNKKDHHLKEARNLISEKNEYIHTLKSEKDNLLEKDVPLVKRGDKQYNRFKKAVLKRDNYTCQCCGSTNAPEVHHQFPFLTYNHLGADTKNGIVLCKDCHQKYHSKYGIKGNTNNPVTFAQFLRDEGKVMQGKLEYKHDLNDSKLDSSLLSIEDLISI